MDTASLIRLEFSTKLRSWLTVVIALFATLIYTVPAALNPDSSWLELGVEVASWSSILLSLACFHALAQTLGKDSGGLREMTWARPISSIHYVLIKWIGSVGMLVLLWVVSTLLTVAVRGFALGAPTSGELAGYLLYNGAIAIPNLIFIASVFLFVSALVDRTMVIYGAGLLAWLAAVVLPRNDKLGYFYPLYLPPNFLSETVGYGGFWQVLLLNRIYGLLVAGLLVLASGYALSARRRMPERNLLNSMWVTCPVALGLILVLGLAPSPPVWLERNQSAWTERALAAVQEDGSYPWQHHEWNGLEGMVLPGGAQLEVVAQVIEKVRAEPELGEPLAIDAVVQVPFLRRTQLRNHVLLLPESYGEPTLEVITRRAIGDLVKLAWGRDDTAKSAQERHALAYVYEWHLTEQLLGREALDQEIDLWRSVIGAPDREDTEMQRAWTRNMNELSQLGARGGPIDLEVIEQALALWDGPVKRERVQPVLLGKDQFGDGR